MTESAFLVNESGSGRAERLLDSAAELLLRWGYQRVTIDDVAKHAGIGKGTVYLHFRTKDALFLTVLLRSHRRLSAALIERIEADPLEMLPSRMLRGSYLDVAADPVARVLYLGDAEVLGRLVHEAGETLGAIAARRTEVQRGYLTRLREVGALRTDLSVDGQLAVLTAVGVGFFMSADAGTDPAVQADLLAHTVAAALETADPSPAALSAGSAGVVAGLQSFVALIDEEWRRRVR
ncbi:TetR/AcrR family transcriptional regulator [Pseudonocardia sp. CA-107938]|uniref:TetR/AcrR family transcriptional regulator n=1 Tax=Pseudonocardia sp. CA-107938 TaxID=3240021 RepID=UPI003D91A92B